MDKFRLSLLFSRGIIQYSPGKFSSVTVQLTQMKPLINYTGELTVNFEQCCITCDDPNYIANTPNEASTPRETYESPSPSVISTSVLLHDHPSCDSDGQEVKFKSSVQFFQPNSGYTAGAKLSAI